MHSEKETSPAVVFLTIATATAAPLAVLLALTTPLGKLLFPSGPFLLNWVALTAIGIVADTLFFLILLSIAVFFRD